MHHTKERELHPKNSVTNGDLDEGLRMNRYLVADKLIVFLIALGQLGICALLLFMEFGVAYGGGFRPILTPFLLAGFVGAWLLFSRLRVPRIMSIVWQAIFAGVILLGPGNPENATDRSMSAIALLAVVVVAYLCMSTFVWQRGEKQIETMQR